MKLLNEIALNLRTVSDEIGENVYENVMEALETREKIRQSQKEFTEKRRKEQEELMARYKELFEHRNVVSSRLMKAFPGMKSIEHNEVLQKLKNFNQDRK